MQALNHEILAAEKRIRQYVHETPLEKSLFFSKLLNTNVYLKCENLQHLGAFKIRGALNKLLSLTPEERNQGITAASSGNHGAAVARGLNQLNIPGIIFLPENTAATKINNIRQFGVPIEFYANDCMETELYAIDYANKHNMQYISPYNDHSVIAGQGTIGVEICQQMDNIDAVFVPIGGGGLISGIGAYIKSVSPNTKIIGCLPENSPVMAASIHAGKVIDLETSQTLSDGTAGNIVHDTITFSLCQQYVDEYVLVSETEIQEAIVALMSYHHQLIEGAAGVALGALMKESSKFKDKNIVAVLSGANIDLAKVKSILVSHGDY